MSKFTDVQYVESFPADDHRVVDRNFATAHRTAERVLFFDMRVN
ncbi:hypothetical protein LMG29739_01360 [Paraburkholderia solisilvae]|uniref:Uncharacterized protein n=1 Tax=Paraburkholderia solisilvae TaxID=624376 RepID=A0A6J5DE56_9BURK|nr:hypothetical protein LMG29739_01360 [Paraburkholderia solisilvae]